MDSRNDMDVRNENDVDIDVEINVRARRRRREEKRKRLRIKMMKKFNILSCAAVFVIISLCMIILKRPEVSNIENRNLAKWPKFSFSSLFSGEYTAGIEEFYNDTAPGREKFKNMTASMRSGFGLKSETAKIHGVPVKQDDGKSVDTVKNKENKKPVEASVQSGASVAASETVANNEKTKAPEKDEDELDDPNVEGEISNNILVYNNRGIMLYGGSYANGDTYAEYVNNFKTDLGVNVYSMVCPTPVSYYLPKKYSDMTASEKDNIEHINENLNGVVPIDAYGALKAHKKEDIFKRTDHHWSQLGAYYAAEEFAKQAGVPFAKLESYKREERDGYVGTLYGYTGDSDLKDNPEKFEFYVPTNNYTTTFYSNDMTEDYGEGRLIKDIDKLDPVSWYLVFIGSDDIVTHVHTDVGNGRRLAIVKDSYGNALVPCLTGSFEDIYVVDMRYFEVNAVAQFREWGITDLLFAMNTFSATGSNFECIEQIRTQ